MAAASSTPAGPKTHHTSASWLLLEDETAEARLLVLVSHVLGINTETIPVHQSFLDLGGNGQSALALRRACMEAGMDVKVKDIVRCSTLAELQTCITPCAPQDRHSESEFAGPVMIAPFEIHRASRMSIMPEAFIEDPGQLNRASTATPHKGQPTEIEQALGAQPEIGRIATVRPKAGLLEGKLVALLTLAGIHTQTAPESTGTVELISPAHAIFAGTQVAFLKRAAKSRLPPDAIPDLWVVLEAMPLTESGDLDMRKLRTWAQNINEIVHHQALSLEHHETLQAPSSEMEKTLQWWVSKVLALPQAQIGVNFSFCQLGGDETAAAELSLQCRQQSIFINPSEVLSSMTISELSAAAASRGGLAQNWVEESSGYFDLSPMQHFYFQTAMGGDSRRRPVLDGSYRFNQSLLLRLKKPISFGDISAAVEAVVGHHSMLRARFGRCPTGWVQRVLPEVAGSYGICNTTIRSDRELEDIIERAQMAINIETGPIFSVDYLSTNDGQQWVYLVAHHLVVDLPSWRTIVHDLDELLQNGSLLSHRSMPFNKWMDIQKAEAFGPDANNPPDINSLLPFALQPGDYAYWGLQDTPNTYGDVLEASFALSQELTTILQTSSCEVFKTDCADIYLAALMLSFAQTFHDRTVPVVWNQENGRDIRNADFDISETVGWFTSLCPLNLKVDAGSDFISVLRHLKDTRRSIPAGGAQYFASRFYRDDGDLAAKDWPFEIIFNHVGSLQSVDRTNGVMEQLTVPDPSLASPTSDVGPNVGRIALFEISASVEHGSARVKFIYSRFSQDQGRISQWVQNYEHLLLEAIGRLRYHQQELTISDVPHLDVTYAGLEKFNKDRVSTLRLASVRDVETIYPATAVQQSILISQAQRPDTCYLHAIYEFASHTGDPIDISRICTAWQQVTMRHAALRTVFTESVTETGLWDKIILRRASPEMLFIDTAPSEDPVHELSNLPNLRPTESKPLHRLTVCKAPTRTLVKLDISTALCDSLSIHILLDDLRRAYATERAIIEPDQFSYPHYLYFLNTAREEKSLVFWRQTLTGVPPCHFPRLTIFPEEQCFVNTCLELDITLYQLSSFARKWGISVDAILRLAWGIVLRSFTGSNQVCFGFQTVGRDDTTIGMRQAVGSFANVVPCSYDLSPSNPVFKKDKTLIKALHMVEEQLLISLPEQHFTLAEMQHAMGTKGGERLFNSCLTFTEEPGGLNSKFTTRKSFELKAISLQQTFDVDVVINTRFTANKLVVDIGQRVMSPEQAVGVANTFGTAICAIIENHGHAVAQVNLFSKRDQAQIMAWDAEYPVHIREQKQAVVHDLIRRQASSRPSAEAICSWDGSLTYMELEEEATKLAHYLVEAGVGPHSVVPVVMDKCKLAPVAMIAVLKTGAAFVPIDSLEMGMIQPIFDRLNSRVAIASELAGSVLRNLFDRVIVLTDELMSNIPEGQGSLTSMATPSDRACVLFVPASNDVRGITFSHAALSTTLLGQAPAAQITHRSRVMQLSSFNVDICITEIFTTLAAGGCVCIPSAVERIQTFTAAVNRFEVNWSYMTPLLSRKLDPSLLPTLGVVCFRTRALDDDTYHIWHGNATVILAYGPQDVCPLGIAFLVAVGPHHLKSIGRPFAGRLLIVNPEDSQPVPLGAVGELVVDGPTIGFSYPNRESTAMSQSPGGLAPRDGTTVRSRHFKTGHRARYTQRGLLEFIISKRDEIEEGGKAASLTEIEQHVRRCLGRGVDVIVETVMFRRMSKRDGVLAAFVELGERFVGEEKLSGLDAATKEQLAVAKQLVEAGLKNKFPPAMIPSVFIPVRHLPITPSLKVNRRTLQKKISTLTRDDLLGLATVANPAKYKPLPLTQGEERMRAIWAKVLGVEEAKIDASDSFFSVGGDDTVAAQLVAACRHEGIAVSIAEVLQDVTLTDLSMAVVVEESPLVVHQQPSPAPMIPQSASPPPFITSSASPPPFTTLSASPSPFIISTGSPVPFMTSSGSPPPFVTPSGSPGPTAIKEVFIEKVIAPRIGVDGSAIADAAEASSAQVRYIETGMLQGRTNVNYMIFNFTGSVDTKKLEQACKILVAIHPILRTAFCPYFRLETVLDKIIKSDEATPIRFETPLTKFTFLDGGKQSILILRLSKAQYDDLSAALLVKDLKRLYDGSQRPPRRPTYCDFVRCTQIANSHGAEDYWRALLEGSVMTQVVAHTQPYRVSAETTTIRTLLPADSLVGMQITFDTVLKGAWAMVLAELSASSDVVFGEIIDGRALRLPGGHSVAGIMGPTVNAMPVRVQFPDTEFTPRSLMQYIIAQRLHGTPFETLGTLTIVEKCTPWPYWTRFSTLVQHQLEDAAIIPTEPKSFHLGTAACKFTIHESKTQDVPDLFVRSIQRPHNKVELTITFCKQRVPEKLADDALKMLSSAIKFLTSVSSIMEPPLIPQGYQYRSMARKIPLPVREPPVRVVVDGRVMSMLSQDQIKGLQRVIADTWTSILNPRALGVPDEHIHNAAFFDLWGSLLPAAQMMLLLNRELAKVAIPGFETNLKVTMEELVENPTMLKQFELVVSKIKVLPVKEGLKGKKDKEKDKGKEKEVEKEGEEAAAEPDAPAQSHKRKPSRIRRFASTVIRPGAKANTDGNITITNQKPNNAQPRQPRAHPRHWPRQRHGRRPLPALPRFVGTTTGPSTSRIDYTPELTPMEGPATPRLPAFDPIPRNPNP
ncbi:hypothetical protein N0V88_006749 [Collariella sp. IMI 366227]|nr:hypothetical protein N0V88_006749 [Collariella sp. IMI 366227]